MKNFILSILLAVSASCFAQTDKVQGVYLSKQGDTYMLALLADGYLSLSVYTDSNYKSTTGGPFTVAGNELEVQIEYDDASPEKVGTIQKYKFNLEGENIKDAQGNLWVKQPSKPQDLDGLWRITGRKKGDSIAKIHQSGTRKTIKLLVDGYFQWMAIDPGAQSFSGTGGGHYTFKDGKYSEHLLFFSRDDSRVGALLTFDGKIENGEWHHSGLSSKGAPIYEIWSREK